MRVFQRLRDITKNVVIIIMETSNPKEDTELLESLERISNSEDPLLQADKEIIRYWNNKPKQIREKIIEILPLRTHK